MKRILFLLTFFSASTLNAMEDRTQQPKRKREEKNQLEETQQPTLKKMHSDEKRLGLPNEIWAQILEHVYFDSSILDEADDIYEGIDIIEKHLNASKNTIDLVCKTFRKLNITQNQ